MSKYQGKPLPSMTGGELDRRCDRVARDLTAICQMATVSAIAGAVFGGPMGVGLAIAADILIARHRGEQGGPTYLSVSE